MARRSTMIRAGMVRATLSASNPASIMGAAAISYFDAKTSALFQNSGGTGSVADGDPVGYVQDLVSGAYIQATSGWRPTYVANAGDPYLSGNASSLRRTLTRTGAIYCILRMRFVTRTGAAPVMVTLTNNATDAYNNNWHIPYFNEFGSNIRNEANGETAYDNPAVPVDAVHTFEFYRSGTTLAVALNGAAFSTTTWSGNLAQTDYIDLFSNIVSGGANLNGNGVRYMHRGAFCNAIPDSTQRAALLAWAG